MQLMVTFNLNRAHYDGQKRDIHVHTCIHIQHASQQSVIICLVPYAFWYKFHIVAVQTLAVWGLHLALLQRVSAMYGL